MTIGICQSLFSIFLIFHTHKQSPLSQLHCDWGWVYYTITYEVSLLIRPVEWLYPSTGKPIKLVNYIVTEEWLYPSTSITGNNDLATVCGEWSVFVNLCSEPYLFFRADIPDYTAATLSQLHNHWVTEGELFDTYIYLLSLLTFTCRQWYISTGDNILSQLHNHWVTEDNNISLQPSTCHPYLYPALVLTLLPYHLTIVSTERASLALIYPLPGFCHSHRTKHHLPWPFLWSASIADWPGLMVGSSYQTWYFSSASNLSLSW